MSFPSFPASAVLGADAPSFAEFPIPRVVLRAIEDVSFTHCTPIQARVFPHSLAGRDVAGQAQTGTGKTAAFLVTLFTRLLARSHQEHRRQGPRALVVAPTRELALQILEEAKKLGKGTGLRCGLAVGGLSFEHQRRDLACGCELLVGTPGRLMDFVRRGVLSLAGVEVVVLDEADRMFDMGFLPDLRFLLRQTPPPGQRQCLLFSATLNGEVERLAREHLHEPVWCRIEPERLVASGIEQVLFHVGGHEKLPLLLGLLREEHPQRAICFVNTKRGAEWLAERLRQHGHRAEALTGDLRQPVRLRRIRDFAAARVPILVATDVAARGLHVEHVTHVFNFDLPRDPENYVHRIGRTGRAGAQGKAISLACEEFVDALPPIEKLLQSKLPVGEVQEAQLVAVSTGSLPRFSPSPRRRGRGAAGWNGNGRRASRPYRKASLSR